MKDHFALVIPFALAGSLSLATACAGDSASDAGAADRHLGRELIAEYGCGSCHAIPGVENADGIVGPPLDNIGARKIIAGRLANTPENMILWITDPQEVDPGNAMPDMGVTEEEAQHIAAYLRALP